MINSNWDITYWKDKGIINKLIDNKSRWMQTHACMMLNANIYGALKALSGILIFWSTNGTF